MSSWGHDFLKSTARNVMAIKGKRVHSPLMMKKN